MPATLKTFIIYARADEGFKSQLLRHLRPLRAVSVWHDGNILPGEEWDAAIKRELRASELVLFLVSADSLNSNYIQSEELKTALDMLQRGQARLVPIVVAPCAWKFDPILSGLQALPLYKNEGVKPVRSWTDPDEAWAGVVEHLGELVLEIEKQREDAAAKASREKVETERDLARRREREAAEAEAALAAKQQAEQRNREEAERRREAERRQREAEEQARQEQIAFAIAAQADTLAVWDEFLRKFPGSGYEKEARQRRKIAFSRMKQGFGSGYFSIRNIVIGSALLALGIIAVNYFGKKEYPSPKEVAQAAPPKSVDNMVLIPGGTFQMGSEAQEAESDEKPIHSVTVDSFYLGATEVTVAEFRAFIDAKKYQTDAEKEGWSYRWNGKGLAKMNGINWRDDSEGNRRQENEYSYPVTHVSWNDAQAYCAWLSEKTGKRYRLPTEAEWEYAAREGGKNVRFGNGKDIADPAEVNFDASDAYKKDYSNAGVFRQKTVPVGSLRSPNALGLHDMSGNVWEWCEDWYHDSYVNAPSDGAAWIFPAGSYRVLRGGSWGDNPLYVRTTDRSGDAPLDRYSSVGFRLAKTL